MSESEVVRATTGASGGRAMPARSMARRLRWPLLVGAPLLAAVIGVSVYLTGGRYVSTDDAYLQAARVQVSANIAGRVIEIPVREGQRVRRGDVLFRLDPRDYQAAAAQASAQLAASRLNVQGLQAGYGQRSAELAAARATLAYQQRELVRQRAMTEGGVSSQALLSSQQHNVEAAKAQVAVAQQALAQSLAALGGRPDGSAEADPAVQQAQASLQRASLGESYTVIRAPQDGTVTRVEQLQVGSYISAAQPLFSLIAPRVWVEANFKEDQLTYMRPGQAASLRLDAYPGVTFPGRVESLSPGTGSSFSVLPPDNATGNWVKVVQRLPVRLSIRNDHPDLPLHAGLSVKVSVDTQHHRALFGENAAEGRRAQPRPAEPRP